MCIRDSGYPAHAAERELLLSGGVERELEDLQVVVSAEEVRTLQHRVQKVKVAEKLADYILAIAEATRRNEEFQLGVSTRGALGLYRAAQALALFEGRDFAVPDDIQRLAPAVLAHRVVLRRGSSGLEAARRAVEVLIHGTPLPI